MNDIASTLTDLLGQGLVIGAHLVSAHSAATYPVYTDGAVEQHRFQQVNPGVYLQLPNGFTAGAYRNSFNVPSVYAGWTFKTEDRRWALTVGAITGYGRHPGDLAPLVVPSVRLGLDAIGAPGWSARLSYAMKNPRDMAHSASALHLSVERQF